MVVVKANGKARTVKNKTKNVSTDLIYQKEYVCNQKFSKLFGIYLVLKNYNFYNCNNFV